ncbi:hypothetical protein NBRC116493_00780 [Aurantivibrio infirmus]
MNKLIDFRSLPYKIGAPTVLVCVVVFSLIASFFYHENTEFIRKNIDNEISYIENTLNIALEGNTTTGDFRRVINALGSGKAIERLILIEEYSGTIVADTQNQHLGKHYNSTLSKQQLQTIEIHLGSKTRSIISDGSKEYIAERVNLISPGANRLRPYLVFLIYDKTFDLEIANRSLLNIIIALSIGLFSLLSLAFLVQYFVLLKPLRKIIHTIRRQTESDELLTIGIDTNDELGLLAKQYDKLAAQTNLKENTLRQLSLRMEVALDATNLGVFEFDLKSNTHIWNSRMYEILGLDQEKFIPTISSWSDCIHPDEKNIVEAKLLHAIKTGESFTFEYKVIQPSNTICTVRTFVKTVCNNQGNVARLVGTLFDITEQKLLSKQREDALIKAEETARLKSEFLASVSHEIRTPMNGVIGMVNLLLKGKLNEKQLQYAQIAKSSAESLLQLINDVLDFSKIDAGKLELELIDFDLPELLGNCVESLAIKAQEKNIELILDTTSLNSQYAMGDPNRIRQIITNLVANAIKFTEAGEIIVSASTNISTGGELNFSCSISDTGIGIPQENIPNLFESFTQIDAGTTRKYGGTGLGLAIVKQLCSIMGGDVSITSEIGTGTTVTFSAQLSSCEKTRADFQDFNFKDTRILVAEKNGTGRSVINKQLELLSASVDVVEDAASALQKAEYDIYSLILIDQNLSDFSCFELADKIRKIPKQSQSVLVLMNRLADLNILEESTNTDFDFSISKPITRGGLVGVARELASRKRVKVSEMKATPIEKSRPEKMIQVLLVEDNPTNQAVVIGILEDFNLEIVTANNGLDALNELDRAESDKFFELVLMDCQMPVLDGYQTTQQIRNGELKLHGDRYKNIPIIALTANAVLGEREKCINAGMNEYIPKPINSDSLIKLIRQFLPSMIACDTTPLNEEAELLKNEDPTFTNADKIWDKKLVLDRVRGKEERLDMLIELFLKNTPQLISQLKDHAGKSAITDVAKIAHTIKGSAGNISGLQLQETASKIEIAANSNTQDEIEILLPSLIGHYQDLAKLLEQNKHQAYRN